MGENISMRASHTLGDWLVGTLDLLRHNARNVLIERWEKRNLSKAVTPPVFDDRPRTPEELRASLPLENELLSKLKTYRKLDGAVVVITQRHIQSLQKQMTTAQESVGRYNEKLNAPLSESETIPLEYKRDQYQERLDQATEELADIIAFLYSE